MLLESVEETVDKAIIDDVERGIFKVHRSAYTDPRVFELEKQRVFNHTWLYAAHEVEIPKPGDYVTRKVAGRTVIIVRGEDDQVRVFLNTCLHRGTPVCNGSGGNAKHFRCPYHAWTYDTKGALTAVPLEDAYGPEWKRSDHGLRSPAKVDTYRGFIFVGFDAKLPSLVDYLAGAKQFLDYVCDQWSPGMEFIPGTHKYSYRANWKLVVENSVDNYHFVILHKRQVQHMKNVGVELAAYGALNPISNGLGLGNGHGVTQHQQIASFGRLAGKWGGNLPAELKPVLDDVRAKLEERVGKERALHIAETNRNLRVFPNLYVLDHISPVIRMITPISVDYTEIQEWFPAPKGEDPRVREIRVNNNNLQTGPAGFIAPEDVECLEQTQIGLMNPEMEWCDNSRGMAERRTLSSDEQQMRGMQRHWHELITMGRVKHPHNY